MSGENDKSVTETETILSEMVAPEPHPADQSGVSVAGHFHTPPVSEGVLLEDPKGSPAPRDTTSAPATIVEYEAYEERSAPAADSSGGGSKPPFVPGPGPMNADRAPDPEKQTVLAELCAELGVPFPTSSKEEIEVMSKVWETSPLTLAEMEEMWKKDLAEHKIRIDGKVPSESDEARVRPAAWADPVASAIHHAIAEYNSQGVYHVLGPVKSTDLFDYDTNEKARAQARALWIPRLKLVPGVKATVVDKPDSPVLIQVTGPKTILDRIISPEFQPVLTNGSNKVIPNPPRFPVVRVTGD